MGQPRDMQPGWVYVMASGSQPGVVKVGRTTRTADGRARELDRAPAYAEFGPWSAVMSCPVSDSWHVETAAHRMLANRRVRLGRSPCRELFRVDAAEACRVVEAAAGSLRGRLVIVPSKPRRAPAARRRWGRPSRRWGRALAVSVVCLTLAWFLEPELVGGLLRAAVRLP